MCDDVDAHTTDRVARELYADAPGIGGWLTRHRPAVCPFELLVSHVPCDATVLDVGCGSGLFLGMLAATRRVRRGLGVDPDARAIARAERMRDRAGWGRTLTFEAPAPDADLPRGPFDVVAMIDVLHHVAPTAQDALLRAAIARVAPGGRFLYKDMAQRPRALALVNRMHDLIVARQWIHYVPIARVVDVVRASGLRVRARADARRYVYAHELVVAERPLAA
jgi:2-polyprenyl-3-methyl-5-hydroxy-6-metoxy-1,4-benzoquinol methylase